MKASQFTALTVPGPDGGTQLIPAFERSGPDRTGIRWPLAPFIT